MGLAPIPLTVRRKRTTPRPLGSFATLTMRAIHELPHANRYGIPIADQVSQILGEIVDLSAIYVTLKRLATSGHVDALEPEPVARNSKRMVRRYRITPKGAEAMNISFKFYEHCHGAEPVRVKAR